MPVKSVTFVTRGCNQCYIPVCKKDVGKSSEKRENCRNNYRVEVLYPEFFTGRMNIEYYITDRSNDWIFQLF